MAKKLWKECRCGRVTDPDERHCPVCGPDKNPRLKLVELDDGKIRALVEEGKVYTKHISEIEEWLFQ